MLRKIIPRAPRPIERPLRSVAGARFRRRRFDTFVEHHHDVCAQRDLNLQRSFRRKKMFGAVQVRTKRHTFVGNFAQFAEAENLEPSRIRQNRSRPRHEFVQPAHLADQFVSGTQIQMVGIRKQNLYTEVFQVPLRLSLHRRRRAHWHERRRINRSVRSSQSSQPRAGRIRRQHLELESRVLCLHPNECIRRKQRSNQRFEKHVDKPHTHDRAQRHCETRSSSDLPLGNLSPSESSPRRINRSSERQQLNQPFWRIVRQ